MQQLLIKTSLRVDLLITQIAFMTFHLFFLLSFREDECEDR